MMAYDEFKKKEMKPRICEEHLIATISLHATLFFLQANFVRCLTTNISTESIVVFRRNVIIHRGFDFSADYKKMKRNLKKKNFQSH